MEEKVCCFTGHRPKSLPWGYVEDGEKFFAFRAILTNEISALIGEGYTRFISGMALGIDMIAAEAVLELKKTFPHIVLECALPCATQEKSWGADNRNRHQKIIKSADRVVYVTDSEYRSGCMQKRNFYMVNESDAVIAAYNGTGGGTKQTMDYATKKGKRVVVIEV